MPVAIFDLDGVIYRGDVLLPHARETVDRLRAGGWQVFFATNNSTASRAEYVARLNGFGLGGGLEHVVTSAFATAQYLDRLVPRPQDVLVIGGEGLREEIAAVGIPVRDPANIPGINPPAEAGERASPALMRAYLTGLDLPPAPDAVVIGLDLHLTYAKLAEAQRAVLAGARFIASNKDRAYPVEGRLLPGAGSIVAAIEIATQVEAVCIGKPEPFLFEEAILRSGSAGPVVVIGDAAEYDIVAAHRAGATGVLVTTGLTARSPVSAITGEARPDHVIDSLDELLALPEFVGLA